MFKLKHTKEEEEEDTLLFLHFVIISILTKVWSFVLIKKTDKDALCQDWMDDRQKEIRSGKHTWGFGSGELKQISSL